MLRRETHFFKIAPAKVFAVIFNMQPPLSERSKRTPSLARHRGDEAYGVFYSSYDLMVCNNSLAEENSANVAYFPV